MDTKKINLEEISNLPDTEFKKHFRDWLESDGVARSLQAKLRKDLIDAFNQTSLGRKMYFQHQRSSRIMLSPLILALNTLVAEFLYAQNCHFSLSVFCTEVPYRNTLPDFESVARFRFSKDELIEIFEAVSGDIQPDIKDKIVNQYLEESSKNEPSLLYLIFKTFFKKHVEPEKIIIGSAEQQIKEDQKPENNEDEANKTKKYNQNTVYNHQFRYLNKYLVILSRKVKEMAYSLEQLQRREDANQGVRRKSLRDRKLESLNRSLERLSENLKSLSISKRKNRNISAILSAIDKLSQHFEKCALNFETISTKLIREKSEKAQKKTDKSYSEWVTELQTTESGKKFIARIESSLRKTLEREKHKMQQDFEMQLENQKELLKLRYKQKVLEQLAKHSSKEENDNDKNTTEIVEEKLTELEKKHQELLKRVVESEHQVRMIPNPLNLQKELSTAPKAAGDENSNKISITTKIDNIRPQEYKPKKVKEDSIFENLKPQLEEMAKTIAQHERNIDHIVFDAKLRIQELENESNQLEQSFQEYLLRQKSQKVHVEESINSVWEKYNLEKTMLNKKCAALRSARNIENLRSRTELHLDNLILNPPTIHIDSDTNVNRKQIETLTFENPFKKLKDEMLTKNNWTNFHITDTLKETASKSKPPANRDTIFKVTEQGSSIVEGKKEYSKSISQRACTIHEITHDEKNIRKQELKVNAKFKKEEDEKVSLEPSEISSEINIKDSSLNPSDVHVSKSSSNKSEADNVKSTVKCRRSLFPKKDEKNGVQISGDDNIKTQGRNGLDFNIFQQSSFQKNGRDINKKDIDGQNKTPELNLDIPVNSPKNFSSSNSTSPSFKLNLSVGKDGNSEGDFWS